MRSVHGSVHTHEPESGRRTSMKAFRVKASGPEIGVGVGCGVLQGALAIQRLRLAGRLLGIIPSSGG